MIDRSKFTEREIRHIELSRSRIKKMKYSLFFAALLFLVMAVINLDMTASVSEHYGIYGWGSFFHTVFQDIELNSSYNGIIIFIKDRFKWSFMNVALSLFLVAIYYIRRRDVNLMLKCWDMLEQDDKKQL